MKLPTRVSSLVTSNLILIAAISLITQPLLARVVDNFDDNTKTDWTDFTFQPGFGLPKETGGQFRFEQPPAKQAIFSASQKKSQTYELKNGRTVEFRVDVAQGGGKDSFAVLAFIPTGNSPGTLAGYGLAKSTTDILITKGINKYFFNENPAEPVKNENITLVLSLTGRDGSVIVNARILDKDAGDAVIFEKTVVDTPAADVLRNGTDDPAAPYLTSGYFTLYLYQDYDAAAEEDPYQVYFDNAEAYVTDISVVDDFNDNTKTDWTDFTFQPGFGLPKETSGQFRFEQPAAKQAIFSASQKKSREFALEEGERIEFRVDVIEGGEKDSFAVLAFIPTANSPGTLAGYGLAKSTTDILISKGINKYFFNENPAEPVKNNNITLVLSLTARNGSVVINTRVLDKDADDAVIFDKTVVDTPAADVLRNGTDDPAAPYLTRGYFTLYLYQDYDAAAEENPYKVYFDNAVAAAPPAGANAAPIIADLQPAEFASFLPAASPVSFRVIDDKAISNSKVKLYLNGQAITNGLTITGPATNLVATYTGLMTNVNYNARIEVTDADNVSVTNVYYFDTFLQSDFTIEAEDYNFAGGLFIDSPVPAPEGSGPNADSYANQEGYADIDFHDTRTSPRFQDAPWRQFDSVRMARSLDNPREKYAQAGGAEALVYDYDVGDIAADEWMQYTRTFPAGSYEVYLRESIANIATADSVLELVTGDRTQPDATTKVVGSFLGIKNGFKYRNVPLTDGGGANKVVLRLSGVVTLRLRQLTADPSDGSRKLNYLLFLPVADAGQQGPAVASVSPANGTSVETTAPTINVTIQNRDTSVRTNTVSLTLNGKVVTPSVTPNADGVTVSYKLPELPASGAANSAEIRFTDSAGVETSFGWGFVVTYRSVDPANRQAGPGMDRGFKVRVVQAPLGSGLENSLDRAERQLAANSTIPKFVDTNSVADVINFNEIPGGAAGNFPDDLPVPGIDPDVNGSDDFAVEILGYLELSAGVHRFGVVSDDGYKITVGKSFTDVSAPSLAFHNGGTANETFDFVAAVAGFYPFRMVWYERGGSSQAEWFSVDLASGDKTLINDPNSPAAVKAYRAVAAPALSLLSSAVVNGPYAAEAGAAFNESARTVTVPMQPGNRFYRIQSDGAAGTVIRFTGYQVAGANLVLSFETTP